MMRTAHWVILAFVLIAAAGSRVYRCAAQPLSYDELDSMETAAGRGLEHLDLQRDVPLGKLAVMTRLAGGRHIWDVPANMQQDMHPPLYFVMLRLWLDCFGDSDVAARSMSIVFGTLGVLLIFDLGRLMGGPAVGLWAAAIMALAQPQIIESQDARPYELAVTLCIAAWDILIRIEKDNGTSRWLFITLAVTVLAAALSHYFAAGVLAAILLYAAIRFYGAKLRATFAAIAAATVAGIVLWGHGFIEQANQPMFNGNWMYWFNDAGPGHVTRTFFRFAALPVRYLAEPTPGSIKLVAAGSVLYLLPFLVLRKRPQLLACALWLICGAGVVMMLDLFRQGKQLDFIKYTLLAAPAVYLMLPMLLKSPHLLGALGVICAAVAIPAAQRDTVDWRPLAKRVATIPTDQPLMIDGTQWGDWYGPILFMAVQRYTPSLPRTIVIVRQPALRPQWIARWQQKQMWILSSPDLAWVSKLLQHRNGQLVWRDSDMELFEIFPISQISAGLKTPTH